MTTRVARLLCDEPTARRLATAIDDSLDGDNLVCSAFEGEDGQWQLAIHFASSVDEAAIRDLVRAAAGELADALTVELIAEADWVAQSLAGLAPVRAGRFIVHGAHDRARVPANALGIEIEAALAFGTGHHGTTRGCLIALDALAKRMKASPIPPLKGQGRRAQRVIPPPAAFGRSLPRKRGRDKKVLDIGTGSGVLAIAAAKRLHGTVVAGDIDRVAVAAARGNARLNRVAPSIAFVQATGVRNPTITRGRPYDLIFANILLGPLTRLAVPLARLTRARTRVVLSGLLPAHANAALSIYRAQGLALERRIPLDGWMTLILRRGRR